MEVGSKVTIISWGFSRLPGTVVGISKSGKTITVKKNKYRSEKRNHGPMVLAIEEVFDELRDEDIKFRWKPYSTGDGGYWKSVNDMGACSEGWSELKVDIGL